MPFSKSKTDDKSVNYHEIVEQSRETFRTGKTLPLEWRIGQLKQALRMLTETSPEAVKALAKDLHRCKFETFAAEIDFLTEEINLTLRNIKEWSATEKPTKPWIYLFDQVKIQKNPYGVVLVIGAWNYPIVLTLLPIVGAIAAGNCVIVKPSEVAATSAKYLYETIPKYFDTECCRVIKGGIAETTELLKERFDYIFYTGSSYVGKIVGAAAAKNLTPVTLELGGKNPLYVDNTVDMSMAAKRILWGKCINVGQTCIAPDYMLCTPEVQNKFIKEAKKILHEWYGEKPYENPDLARIVSEKHFRRLVSYLNDKSQIAIGGDVNPAEYYISPTILVNVKPDDPIMQDEIFGPILPIINVNNVREAINFIRKYECPLALYIFSKSKEIQDQIIDQVSCGAVCVNDTLLQYTIEALPFGGVGHSGMGAYHGKYTFDTFTHKKGCVIRNYNKLGENIEMLRFPPYSDQKLNLLRQVSKRKYFLIFSSFKYSLYLFTFCLGVFATIGIDAAKKVLK